MICNCKLVKCKDRHFLQNFKFDFSMIYCLQNPFNKNTFNIYSKFKCNTFIIFAPIFHQLEDIKLFFFIKDFFLSDLLNSVLVRDNPR